VLAQGVDAAASSTILFSGDAAASIFASVALDGKPYSLSQRARRTQ